MKSKWFVRRPRLLQLATAQPFLRTTEEIAQLRPIGCSEMRTRILDIPIIIQSDVCPSHIFRTTEFLLTNICPLVDGHSVCDMGCGAGIVGLYALKHGASKVVQADISYAAICNAQRNKLHLHHSDESLQIFHSDCFDGIPLQMFDVIIFNLPFHNEPRPNADELYGAFHDPGYQTATKFLQQAPQYMSQKSVIIIAFSNKGDTNSLEKIMTESAFNWKLWKQINTHTKYDNRLYQLSLEM